MAQGDALGDQHTGREFKTENYLLRELKKIGAKAYKLQFIGSPGAPDRLVLYSGLTFFVEVKREKGGRLSPAQKLRFNEMVDHGVIVHIVNTKQSVDDLIWHIKKQVGKQ